MAALTVCDVVRISETLEIFPLTAHSLGDTKISLGPRDSTDSEPKFITKAATYNFLDCLCQKRFKTNEVSMAYLFRNKYPHG